MKETTKSFNIGMKISTALLKHKGEISENTIKAIPFVSEVEAALIIKEIIKSYDVEIITKKTRTRPFLEWTRIIKLKN